MTVSAPNGAPGNSAGDTDAHSLRPVPAANAKQAGSGWTSLNRLIKAAEQSRHTQVISYRANPGELSRAVSAGGQFAFECCTRDFHGQGPAAPIWRQLCAQGPILWSTRPQESIDRRAATRLFTRMASPRPSAALGRCALIVGLSRHDPRARSSAIRCMVNATRHGFSLFVPLRTLCRWQDAGSVRGLSAQHAF